MDTNYRINNPVIHYGILFLIYGVGLLTLFSHTLFHAGHDHNFAAYTPSSQSASNVSTASCKTTGKQYTVVFSHNHASPEDINARLCDKLTFINRDNTVREIAFGPHEQHEPYDGIDAKLLRYNQSFTITLNAQGMYHYHDHFHDVLFGHFSVK